MCSAYILVRDVLLAQGKVRSEATVICWHIVRAQMLVDFYMLTVGNITMAFYSTVGVQLNSVQYRLMELAKPAKCHQLCSLVDIVNFSHEVSKQKVGKHLYV